MIDGLSGIEEQALVRLGGSTITIGGLVAAAVVLGAAWFASWLATRGLRRVRARAVRTAAALHILEKLTGYGLIIFGAVAALSVAGVNLSSLAVFAGALGIGVGLGLQGVVKEFVSGLFLIFDRMLGVGDYVELEDGRRGVIAEIGPRAARLRTNDNIHILVPNSQLIEKPVINWTLKGDTRRIHIPFAVAYGADRARVRDAVLKAARESPFTMPETAERKSQVWLVGFGDSGLNFELLVWPTADAVKRPAAMQAAYTWAIADALDEAGIEVPFPQTDLRIRSLFGREGDEALDALGLAADRRSPPRRQPARPAAPNDAAEDVLKSPAPDENREDPGEGPAS